MICDLLALRLISHFVQKTLSFLHSTKIEQITKTMVMFKTGAIFLCCIRYHPIPPQTSVQRLAHTHNVTTCCSPEPITILLGTIILFEATTVSPPSETVLKHSNCFFPLYISCGSRGRAQGTRSPLFFFLPN